MGIIYTNLSLMVILRSGVRIELFISERERRRRYLQSEANKGKYSPYRVDRTVDYRID